MNKNEFENIWNNIKLKIESESFDDKQIKLALEGSKILEYKNDILVLGAETKINEVILNKMHFQEILKIINENINSNIKLKIIHIGDYDEKETTRELEDFLIPLSNSLNQKFNFQNFIVSDKNKMLYKAALAVSIVESSEWNPLFIYGKSGLGKTHLLHAIGNSRKKNFPNHSIKYIEAKDFGQIVMNSLDSKNVNSEIEKLNKEFFGYDMLLIDDIQFIKSRKKTKEIFFNIFNYFIQNNKNIIVTSDLSPEELIDFEERFITRFKSGLSLKILPPDYTTTKEILKAKIENSTEFNLTDFEDEALDWISLNFSDNVRFLEGALNRILLYFINNLNESNKKSINLSFVKEIFSDIKTNKLGLSQDKIINTVAKKYNISKNEILGKSRKKEIILPRNISIYLIREFMDVSLMEIGKKFSKDHSTILNSLNKIKKEMEKNILFERDMNVLKNEITSF